MTISPAAAEIAVGIDVGGTNCTTCAIDRDGTMLGALSHPTPQTDDGEALLSALADTAQQLITRLELRSVAGIGIGVPGTVSADERQACDCPNLRALDGTRPPDYLQDRLGVPAWMQNDAYCATLAELRYGAGRPYDNLVMLTLGTGVGGGIALGNRVHRGPRQVMGEVGHIILDPNGPSCNCGTEGCVEAYVGKDALVHRAISRVPAYPDSALCGYVDEEDQVSPKLIAELAAQGDELCCSVMDDAGFYIGLTLCNIIVVCDPDVVLIGGGIAGAGELLFGPIRQTVKRRTPISGFDPANIIPCGLGSEAGAIGAGALVWERSCCMQ